VTAPLKSEYTSVDPILFGISYFRPLAASPNAIAAKRWGSGMVLPYRWVSAPATTRTADASYSTIRLHVIAATFTDAARAGKDNDDRAQVLVDYPGWTFALPDGRVVACEWFEIPEAAHEEPYAAETVATRFVSEYKFGASLVTA
jgi:hypothetical protein